MGIGPFAQWIWGRPVLKTRFERDAQGNDRCLIIFLRNAPVKNAFLKRLVQRNSVDSLTAWYQVSEVGSSKILLPVRQLLIYSDSDGDDNGRWRVTLPPTYSVGASIMPVVWDHSLNAVVLPPSRTQPEIIKVSRGLYRADIVFSVNGEAMNTSRTFAVGDSADDLYWVPTG